MLKIEVVVGVYDNDKYFVYGDSKKWRRHFHCEQRNINQACVVRNVGILTIKIISDDAKECYSFN